MTALTYVAEMTINHLGMVAILKEMIKEAKLAGASLVKLKLKNVDKYYSDDGKKWRNFDFRTYRKSLELSLDDLNEIDSFCQELSIPWFCTVHDEESLDTISQYNPRFYKIASMDVGNENFRKAVAEKAREKNSELIVSVGGKDWNFVDQMLQQLSEMGIGVHLLHTVSVYPTPIGKSSIGSIRELKKRYAQHREWLKIGYSGHEIGIGASIAAAVLGADMIERHFTLTRDWNIHHINAALTPDEFKMMVELSSQAVTELEAPILEVRPEEKIFLESRVYQ